MPHWNNNDNREKATVAVVTLLSAGGVNERETAIGRRTQHCYRLTHVNGFVEFYDSAKAPKLNPCWSMVEYKSTAVTNGESRSCKTRLSGQNLRGSSTLRRTGGL